MNFKRCTPMSLTSQCYFESRRFPLKKLFRLFVMSICCSISSYAYQTTTTLDMSATYIDIRSSHAKELLGEDMIGAIWVNPQDLLTINNFLKTSDKRKKYIVFCSCPHDEHSIALAEIMDREGYENVYVLEDGWDILSDNHLTTRRSLQ